MCVSKWNGLLVPMARDTLSSEHSFQHLFTPSRCTRKPSCYCKASALRSRIRRLEDALSNKEFRCCKKFCLNSCARDPSFLESLKAWRKAWASLDYQRRERTLFDFVRENLRRGESGGKAKIVYSFLQLPVCMRTWHLLTGVGRGAVVRLASRILGGDVDVRRRTLSRQSAVLDAMHGAIWCLIQYCQERMPTARARSDFIIMPMHHRVQLFNMLKVWYEDSLQSEGSTPLLLKEPKYKSFIKVLRREQFQKVRFHRVVEMGRCPVCQWLAWRMWSCAPEHREEWNQRATRHQLRQLEQNGTTPVTELSLR